MNFSGKYKSSVVANYAERSNAVKFRFTNIMLPDSSSDLFGSQGFLQYRIKPNANLPLGTQIKNRAHIYFDFNSDIITNTSIANYTNTFTKNNLIDFQKEVITINPNPSIRTFTLSQNVKTIEVFNLIGELVLNNRNTNQINLEDFSKGIYVAKINGEVAVKLVKE